MAGPRASGRNRPNVPCPDITAQTSTFLGERYRRLVKRCGILKALAAIAHTLLVIIWHLLVDRAARYDDLGPDGKARSHTRQLEASGFTVTVAAPHNPTPDAS